MNITFIGLGIMGSRMAAHLVRSGNELTVWNRTKKKADELVKMGAKESPSLSDSVKNADIIITMLASPEVVENIALSPVGFLSRARKNSLWINTSTVNPSFAEEMNIKAREAGIRYLDAPVSGSKIPAGTGDLVFWLGGEEKDIEQAQPLLSLMGKNIHVMGNAGKGSSMKMVVNLFLAQSLLAFSEAISLGKACGLSQEVMFNSLLVGPLTPAFLQGKRVKMAEQEYDPEFPLKWAYKDLHLMMQTAYEKQTPMPMTALAKEIFGMALAEGEGEKDIASIFSYVQKRQR
jgi:3-hydroxyisobutyrate dehydrogenase/glyoxylate/succinic semialdehyde reductase